MTDASVQQDTIYTLAASGSTLYAGRASGLYRTTDGGICWQALFDVVEAKSLLAVTALVADGKTVFAGVNGAVLRSSDGGDSWEIVGLSSPAPQVIALALSPHFQADGVIAAGTARDGVFVSTDRGATWVPWNFGLVDPNVNALVISPDFSRDHTLFAGTESGVFRSHNGGRSWRETAFPMSAAPVLSLAISPDGRLYAGTEAHGLFASDDLGVSWRLVENELTAVNAIDARESRLWMLLEDRLMVSANGGSAWTEYGHIPAGTLAMTMLVQPNVVLVGSADGDLLQLR